MVNHESPNGNDAAPAAAPIPPMTPQGASRRRMAGLGASGVLMTVASNHALAALVCKSPSGALSGNLNSHKPNVSCTGVSPGYWKNHAWPSEVKSTDLFSQYFSSHNALGSMTCMTVLSKQKIDKNNVAMHIMATYLNVVDGRITFLSRQAVIEIWRKYERDGVYTPTDGALPWSGEKLVDYLKSTMS